MTGAVGVLLPSWYRSRRMVQRNLLVYKHQWIVIFTGFFEPVFYLFGIGLGIGALVSSVDGISYVSFVAPGLLAASCLNGAVTDGCFNIWFKLHFMKTYDGILATPMRVPDVAFGEMLWAVTRGSIYAGCFLIVLLVVGGVTGRPVLLSPLAIFAFPAAVLAATSFSALFVCITTFVRKLEDFDIVVGLAVMRGQPRVGERRAVCDDVNRPRPVLASVAASVGRMLAQPGASARLGYCLAQRVGERCIEEQRLRRDWLDCCNTDYERTGNSGGRH